MVKEGAGDSDSDDSCYARKHGKSGSCGDAAAHVLEMQEGQERPAKAITHVLDNEDFQVPWHLHSSSSGFLCRIKQEVFMILKLWQGKQYLVGSQDAYGLEKLVAEELGKQVHGYMTRIGFDLLSFAASTLVHIYTLCGNIKKTRHVFNEMLRLDLVPWTSLIIGYVQNAQADEALQFSGLLFKSRTQPDHITFVGVPSICTHVDLASVSPCTETSQISRGVEHAVGMKMTTASRSH
ncbi:hypothetical protein VitviT2T_030209 [Vitis vinifera]|uniref:Pentatricopeptide repeat-containing protein n=1 Tax=Vitis vinifera TaxID=29760 RepID=A0ABY9DZB0_VITVI|nr:hypothetical protein VitviT2T_030209 [Vitis vinifera]